MASPVAHLPGLGPVTVRRLAEIGITSQDELRAAGSVAVFHQLRFRFGREVTLNALYGLEAAIRGIDGGEIDQPMKQQLKQAAGR